MACRSRTFVVSRKTCDETTADSLPDWLEGIRLSVAAGSGAVQVASRNLEDSVQTLLELAPTPSPTRLTYEVSVTVKRAVSRR
jgi:hypothetical protein